MDRPGRALGQKEKLAAEDHDVYERGCELASRSLEEGALQMAVSSSAHSARELLKRDDKSPNERIRRARALQVVPNYEDEELDLPIEGIVQLANSGHSVRKKGARPDGSARTNFGNDCGGDRSLVAWKIEPSLTPWQGAVNTAGTNRRREGRLSTGFPQAIHKLSHFDCWQT